MPTPVINIIIAGLGGQGVIKASDILADTAFRAGLDVKKAEVHGMSQRGGSVASDVRFGPRVDSPMVPAGEADFLLVLEPSQIDNNRHQLKPTGLLITPAALTPTPGALNPQSLPNPKTLNVALLGVLSQHLDLPEPLWLDSLAANLPEKLLSLNRQAFTLGRTAPTK